MKKIELTTSLGQTIQIRQFEPRNFYISIKAELNEGDDIQECRKLLMQDCKDAIKDEIETIKKKLSNQDGQPQ